MTHPSERLVRRIRQDFPADLVEDVIRQVADLPETLPLGESQDAERLQAAVVIPARGDREAFLERLALASVDWRDLLMYTGFEHADWAVRLDEELGSA